MTQIFRPRLAIAFCIIVLTIIVGLLARGVVADSAEVSQSFLPFIAHTSGLTVEPVGHDLTQVTAITHAGDDRLFVGQRTGEIFVLNPDGSQSMFLDLSTEVESTGSENGLYAIAFHPDFATNGLLFVSYTSPQAVNVDLVLARFRVEPGSSLADPDSKVLVMVEPQTSQVHKGGGLDFDRGSNQLYMGVGEDRNSLLAQDSSSLKGKVLRFEVDDIPIDFVGDATDKVGIEIWAMGLRNPWRIDVDEVTGLLYIADVGSATWEEVNVGPTDAPVANFGWPCLEGPAPTEPSDEVAVCLNGAMPTDPLFAYAHEDDRCAIIGGSVYRPLANPDDGRYIFGDLCSREVFALPTGSAPADPTVSLGIVSNSALITLGEDAAGNIYAGESGFGGVIFRLGFPPVN